MSKTCIVCGQADGSGEHVFPASPGGAQDQQGHLLLHARQRLFQLGGRDTVVGQ